MELRFSQHESFHRAAIAMVATGFGFGALAHLVSWPHGLPAGLIGGTLGVVAGAALGYQRLWPRLALGVLACAALAVSNTWAAMIGCGAVTALALALGTQGGRRYATIALGTAVSVVACWVAIQISFAQQTHAWSGALVDGTAAAAMGMLGALALLPRHVGIGRDAVVAAVARLPLGLDTEVRNLCNQSVSLWTQANARMVSDPENRDLLRQGVVKVLEVAAKESAPLASGSDAALRERIVELETRIGNATDDETRTQYQAAKQALTEQQLYREKLSTRRDRLVAKLHHHVAALEKFQLAALGAQKDGEARPVLGRLAELSAEVTSTSEALMEVEQVVA